MHKEKNKKVLFIMQLPPPVHGVSVMSEIIRDSNVLKDQFHCEYVNLGTSKHITDLQKNSTGKYFSTLKIIASVIFKLIFKRYDKIYITLFPFGLSFFKDAILVILCKWFGYKPLLHLHTYGFKKASATSALRFKFYKTVFRNTQVICLSNLLVEDIEELYSGDVFILPNGIPQVNFENTYGLRTGPVRLLYLSNLIKGKGILVLIEALNDIKKSGLDFHLRIVGAENDVTYTMLETILKEKNLSGHVSLVGAKVGLEKYMEYRHADIFILPSNYDTFGLVLLEAMQFGVPCISTRFGGIPDVLGEGRGMLLSEITAEEVSKTIIQLIKNPALRLEMSEKAFAYFKANFTSSKFENTIASILNNQPLQVNTRLVNNKL